MIQIATPISRFFENNNAKEIIAVSDCLEVRERSLESRLPKQYLFHFDIDIIHEWNDKRHDYLLKAFTSKRELRMISFQATACCTEPEIRGKMFHPGGKICSRDEMINFARVNIKWLRSVLEDKVEIAVENNNYYPTEAYNVVTDGCFVLDIVCDNDIYFLFDIAHAMVTAHNRRVSFEEYISTLPLEKTIQIHLCCPGISTNGIAYDDHELPDEDMYSKVMSFVQEYDSIKYLTVEYYKDKDILIESLKRLRQILDSRIL